jgi:beta-fructofuranosidase
MNDPNGCFYDKTDKIWHLYFQYNPRSNVWDQPLYWGHAISKDLNTWKEQPIAIGPPNDRDGVFSGSIYIDSDNLSGFF